MKKLRILFAERIVYAKLLVDEAPKTVAALEAHCPFEALLHHAKICDNEIFFHAPFNVDENENPVYSAPGHVGFFNTRQTICMWYDTTVPLGCCNLFALVEPRSMQLLAEACAHVWDEQGGIVKLEVVDEGE